MKLYELHNYIPVVLKDDL